MNPVLIALLVTFSLLMTIQAAYTLYLMLYTWDQQTSYEDALAPRTFRPPHHSFTVLLPARHEEAVIGRTIERVMQANYPRRLIEALVICEANDTGTIAAAQEAIAGLAARGITGVRVITFDDGPINKPHGLNKGLAQARHDVVTIFDAEDEIHPDIFHVVNTVMRNEGARVVQSGVQLMNYSSTWFSAHNVLEYYFWFKSRLHVHAKNGMTPLGGNTVFFNRRLLEEIGGWDEKNLTEDADIGIRLSVRGERVRVVYDDVYVTREETPPNLKSFVKQRTRWNQGFLQTLRKGDWRRVPRRSNRFMAAYILAFPFIQALLGAYVPISLAMMLWVKLPVLITIPLLLPGYVLLAHYLITTVGLYEFARSHQLRLPRFWGLTALHLFVTYFPYQWVLAFAAVKALWRELRGVTNWEKTAHVGAHRDLAPPVSIAAPIAVAADEILTEVMQAEAAAVSEVADKLRPARSPRFVRSRVLAAWMVGPLLCASLLGPLSWGIGGMAKSLGSAVPLPALGHAIAVAAPIIHFGKLPPSGRTSHPSHSRAGHRRLGVTPPDIFRRSQDSLVVDHVASLPDVRIPGASPGPQHLSPVGSDPRAPAAHTGHRVSRPGQQVSVLHVGTTRSNLPRGSHHAAARGFAAPSHAVSRPITVVSQPVVPVVAAAPAAPPARYPAAPQTPARPTGQRPVPVLVPHAAPPPARPVASHPAAPSIAVQVQPPRQAAPPLVRPAAPPAAHPSAPPAGSPPGQAHHGGPPPVHHPAPQPAPAPRQAPAPPQPTAPPPAHHKQTSPPSQAAAPQPPPPAPQPAAKQPASPPNPAPQPAPAKQPAPQPPPTQQPAPQPAPGQQPAPPAAQQPGPTTGRQGGQPPQPAPTPAAPAPNPAPPQPGQPPAPSPGGHGKGHP